MNLSELLGATFNCECGRRHKIPVKTLIYAEDALDRLSDVMEACVHRRRAVVIADRRTWDIAGTQAFGKLERSGWENHRVIVPDAKYGCPVCDDTTFAWLKDRIRPVDIALAVGSGVINDLTKWFA